MKGALSTVPHPPPGPRPEVRRPRAGSGDSGSDSELLSPSRSGELSDRSRDVRDVRDVRAEASHVAATLQRVRRLPMISEEDKKPSLEKLVEERDLQRQRRFKFHGHALQWSRQSELMQQFDVDEYAAFFDGDH
ncbi:unnamed protein product [Durusdinium trenchii]|uniref:Uncharacterized protein n=1 Tax=Durusdinium trenchii TaxID=1381693 RepID=A0ABP0PRL2_9DINO